MPAFNFQPWKAPLVERGESVQTIRAKRKNRPRIGQIAHCFVGMRHPGCRCLGRFTIRRVLDVRILGKSQILLNGGPLPERELDAFARLDGFEDWATMAEWFAKTHGLNFHGDLIIWDYNDNHEPHESTERIADMGKKTDEEIRQIFESFEPSISNMRGHRGNYLKADVHNLWVGFKHWYKSQETTKGQING